MNAGILGLGTALPAHAIAVLGLFLEHEHREPGARQHRRQGAPADTGARDHDVEVEHGRVFTTVGGGDGKAYTTSRELHLRFKEAYAWSVFFGTGEVSYGVKTSSNAVRAVRGGL